jgi:hypothetical protein
MKLTTKHLVTQDGKRISSHMSQVEALEKALGIQTANPESEVLVVSETRLGARKKPKPTPEPVPDPEPLPPDDPQPPRRLLRFQSGRILTSGGKVLDLGEKSDG